MLACVRRRPCPLASQPSVSDILSAREAGGGPLAGLDGFSCTRQLAAAGFRPTRGSQGHIGPWELWLAGCPPDSSEHPWGGSCAHGGGCGCCRGGGPARPLAARNKAAPAASLAPGAPGAMDISGPRGGIFPGAVALEYFRGGCRGMLTMHPERDLRAAPPGTRQVRGVGGRRGWAGANGMEWNGMEWNGMEWNGMEWNGMEWNGMEWNGIACLCLCMPRSGCVPKGPGSLRRSIAAPRAHGCRRGRRLPARRCRRASQWLPAPRAGAASAAGCPLVAADCWCRRVRPGLAALPARCRPHLARCRLRARDFMGGGGRRGGLFAAPAWRWGRPTGALPSRTPPDKTPPARACPTLRAWQRVIRHYHRCKQH
jgi:hypothetical protein